MFARSSFAQNSIFVRIINGLLFYAPFFAVSSSAYGLTFQQALDHANDTAPALAAQSAAITVAEQMAIPADALPDPKLSLGVTNLPIEGANQFSTSADMMTMRQIGIMQEFPNRAKRRARAAAARSELSVLEQERELTRINALSGTASAWLMLFHLNAQRAVLDQWEQENQVLARAVSARLKADQGMVTDSVLPRQEAALLDERRDLLARDLHHAHAELQTWLGNAANEPQTGEPPQWHFLEQDFPKQNFPGQNIAEALDKHPALQIFELKSKQLAAELAEARADKRPDWAVEMMYGQRQAPMAEDMVSVTITVDLPVFGARRQNPRIAAKLAQQDQLVAEREMRARELVALLSTEMANYQQLQRAWQRQKEILLPLAEEKVELASAAWRANRLPLLELMSARRERLNAQLRLHELAAQRDIAGALLHLTFGAPTDLRYSQHDPEQNRPQTSRQGLAQGRLVGEALVEEALVEKTVAKEGLAGKTLVRDSSEDASRLISTGVFAHE